MGSIWSSKQISREEIEMALSKAKQIVSSNPAVVFRSVVASGSEAPAANGSTTYRRLSPGIVSTYHQQLRRLTHLSPYLSSGIQWAFIVKEALDKSFLLAKFFCVVHVTDAYLCSTALVHGPSMLPTFSLTNEIVLLERISTRNGKAGHGDVVVLRSPENPRKCVTKRIIGMEGDNITYIVDPKNSDRTKSLTVPKGHVWVQGDNIYNSYDSRNFGPVPYGLLRGKVFWRIWPAGVFGSIGRKPETVDPALKRFFWYPHKAMGPLCIKVIHGRYLDQNRDVFLAHKKVTTSSSSSSLLKSCGSAMAMDCVDGRSVVFPGSNGRNELGEDVVVAVTVEWTKRLN
ncbi:hypothetical protein E3N88_42953 [Mikania micrantha]|uniref:Peptidase S26 domain-containing protein n=1 Tax=Mikania micrantha TaxID=192012 RepID=A0A5N6LGE6_9ASTR|nr:hypothetical protein E3N88_42953 [Mikania micrantha]